MRTASRQRVSLIVPSVFMVCSSPGLMKSGKPAPEPGINRDVCQESGTSRGVIAPELERPSPPSTFNAPSAVAAIAGGNGDRKEESRKPNSAVWTPRKPVGVFSCHGEAGYDMDTCVGDENWYNSHSG